MNWVERRDQLAAFKVNLDNEEKQLRMLALRTGAAMEKGSRMYPSLKRKMDIQKEVVLERRKTYANMLAQLEKDFPKIKRHKR